jgi:hypothetical protein
MTETGVHIKLDQSVQGLEKKKQSIKSKNRVATFDKQEKEKEKTKANAPVKK